MMLRYAARRTLGRALSTARPAVTTFSEDEAMMRDAVARWASEELQPLVADMDRESHMRKSVIDSLFSNGLMGVEMPEEWGGTGASFTSALLVIEEIARVDPAVAVLVDIKNTLINNMIKFWASPALQEEWGPRLATGTVGSFCLSEPASGSDAFALKTKATRDAGGDYITIDGEKAWISNSSEHAGVFLVMANADPAAGYKGITCFVVDAGTPGLTVGAARGQAWDPRVVHVPRAPRRRARARVQRPGRGGKGYKYAIEILNEGRIGIGAQMVGLARRGRSIGRCHTCTSASSSAPRSPTSRACSTSTRTWRPSSRRAAPRVQRGAAQGGRRAVREGGGDGEAASRAQRRGAGRLPSASSCSAASASPRACRTKSFTATPRLGRSTRRHRQHSAGDHREAPQAGLLVKRPPSPVEEDRNGGRRAGEGWGWGGDAGVASLARSVHAGDRRRTALFCVQKLRTKDDRSSVPCPAASGSPSCLSPLLGPTLLPARPSPRALFLPLPLFSEALRLVGARLVGARFALSSSSLRLVGAVVVVGASPRRPLTEPPGGVCAPLAGQRFVLLGGAESVPRPGGNRALRPRGPRPGPLAVGGMDDLERNPNVHRLPAGALRVLEVVEPRVLEGLLGEIRFVGSNTSILPRRSMPSASSSGHLGARSCVGHLGKLPLKSGSWLTPGHNRSVGVPSRRKMRKSISISESPGQRGRLLAEIRHDAADGPNVDARGVVAGAQRISGARYQSVMTSCV